MPRIRLPKCVIITLALASVIGLAMGASAEKASPVTDKIVFMSNRDGNWEIYIMDVDGSNPTNLTNTPMETEMNPHFSPDGSTILFQSKGSLYTMSPDGSERTLIPTDDLFVFNARFSWNGTKIVFSAITREEGELPPTPGQGQAPPPSGKRQPPVPPAKGQPAKKPASIYVMNANGTDISRLTHSELDDTWPCFSPDETKIVFERRILEEEKDWAAIFIINADGSNEQQLTDGSYLDQSPYFSPDGEKIVFQRRGSKELGRAQILTMKPDGTGLINLTNNEYDQLAPVFSYDGAKIAYHSNMHGEGLDFNICMMNADGSDKTRLTSSGRDWNPTFSPSTH